MFNVVAQACNLSTSEAEAKESTWFKANLGYIVRPCFKKREREGEMFDFVI